MMVTRGWLVRPAIIVTSVLVLGGCASLSPDGGFGGVSEEVRSRTGMDSAWARTDGERSAIEARVAELLRKRPLGADDAVQVAILNNRGLQASFAELGMAEADMVQAGRLPNPHFSMFRAKLGHEYKIEQALTFNLFSLVTTPLALEIEKRRFARAQMGVAVEAPASRLRNAQGLDRRRRRRGNGSLHGQGPARRRRERGTGAAHGAGRQLEQACPRAGAGLLRRRGAQFRARRTGAKRRDRAPDPPHGIVGRPDGLRASGTPARPAGRGRGPSRHRAPGARAAARRARGRARHAKPSPATSASPRRRGS